MVLKILLIALISYSVSAVNTYTDDWSFGNRHQFEEIPDQVESSFDLSVHDESESMAEGQVSRRRISENLLYRLDVVPCDIKPPLPENTRTYRYTNVYFSKRRNRFICYINKRRIYDTPFALKFQKNRLEYDEHQPSGRNYRKRMIKLYHIQCPEKHSCKLNITDTDLEGRVTIGGKKICLDYILIESGSDNNHSNEYCGKEEVINYPFNGSLRITFRSGKNVQGKGFMLIAKSFPDSNAVVESSCLHYSNAVSVNDYLQFQRPQEKLLNKEFYITDEQEQEQTIPYGSAEVLLRFHLKNRQNSSKLSNHSYDGMLRLAVLAERSCDQVMSAIAKSVLMLFPKSKITSIRNSQA